MIGVVDVGLGNLRSVVRALERVAENTSVELVSTPEDIARAERLVFPGQGAFGAAAHMLDSPVGVAIKAAILSGRRFLGICLGLQLLFESSEESAGARGLGIFPGRIVRLPAQSASGDRLKVPRTGFAEVAWTDAVPDAFTASGRRWFYFTHSYCAVPGDETLVAARTDHGGTPVVAAITRDNVMAVQFHPEKSQTAGRDFLQAFVSG